MSYEVMWLLKIDKKCCIFSLNIAHVVRRRFLSVIFRNAQIILLSSFILCGSNRILCAREITIWYVVYGKI